MAAPTTPSLAFKLETWAIDILEAHPTFAEGYIPIVHNNEETDAASSRIVCTATMGERLESGVEPYEVELNVRIYLIGREQHLIEHYARAISEALDDPQEVESLYLFSYLSLVTVGEEEKDNRPDSRQRAKNFLFHALEYTFAMAGDSNVMAGDTLILAGAGEL